MSLLNQFASSLGKTVAPGGLGALRHPIRTLAASVVPGISRSVRSSTRNQAFSVSRGVGAAAGAGFRLEGIELAMQETSQSAKDAVRLLDEGNRIEEEILKELGGSFKRSRSGGVSTTTAVAAGAAGGAAGAGAAATVARAAGGVAAGAATIAPLAGAWWLKGQNPYANRTGDEKKISDEQWAAMSSEERAAAQKEFSRRNLSPEDRKKLDDADKGTALDKGAFVLKELGGVASGVARSAWDWLMGRNATPDAAKTPEIPPGSPDPGQDATAPPQYFRQPQESPAGSPSVEDLGETAESRTRDLHYRAKEIRFKADEIIFDTDDGESQAHGFTGAVSDAGRSGLPRGTLPGVGPGAGQTGSGQLGPDLRAAFPPGIGDISSVGSPSGSGGAGGGGGAPAGGMDLGGGATQTPDTPGGPDDGGRQTALAPPTGGGGPPPPPAPSGSAAPPPPPAPPGAPAPGAPASASPAAAPQAVKISSVPGPNLNLGSGAGGPEQNRPVPMASPGADATRAAMTPDMRPDLSGGSVLGDTRARPPADHPSRSEKPAEFGYRVRTDPSSMAAGYIKNGVVRADAGMFGGMAVSRAAEATRKGFGDSFGGLPKDIQDEVTGAVKRGSLDLNKIAPHAAPRMSPEQHQEMRGQGVWFEQYEKTPAGQFGPGKIGPQSAIPDAAGEKMASDDWWRPMLDDKGGAGPGQRAQEPMQLASADANPAQPEATMPNINPDNKSIWNDMWNDSSVGTTGTTA